MNLSGYEVEFNGYDYVVYLGRRAVGAFATIDEAFDAKRNFEQSPLINVLDKTPPAMRAAKKKFHPSHNA